MGRKCETIFKKVTSGGVEVKLVNQTLIKTYSRTSVTITTFGSHKEAKKEFSKFRHGWKQL